MKEKLDPVPAIEPYAVRARGGEEIVVLNVPPALTLVGRRRGDAYEFPLRTTDSRRYMRLTEVAARMQNRDRIHRLRLAEIGNEDPVGLDAKVDRELGHDEWRVVRVEEDIVVLRKDNNDVPVPLAYVEAVYRVGFTRAEWVIALSCYVSEHKKSAIVTVTKDMPFGRNDGHYRSRGLADEG